MESNYTALPAIVKRFVATFRDKQRRLAGACLPGFCQALVKENVYVLVLFIPLASGISSPTSAVAFISPRSISAGAPLLSRRF